MTGEVIVLRYGEISLKTPYVRTRFETTLVRNITRALATAGIEAQLTRERGRIYCKTDAVLPALDVLSRVSGLVSFSSTVQTTADVPSIEQEAVALGRQHLSEGTRFALRVTRSGTHPYTSQDLARTIGDAVRIATKATVDLSQPTVELFIEVRGRSAYLYTEKIRGIGGLPVGTQGLVLCIIDRAPSLLAAWFLMHRGCTPVLAVSRSVPVGIAESFCATWHLAEKVTYCDMASAATPADLRRLAQDQGCDAVASGATLAAPVEALAVLTNLKQYIPLPLLTPLIAFSDQEIARLCKQRRIA